MQGQPAKGQAATKQGQVATGDPDPVGNSTKGILYCLTPATDVGRGDTKRHRTARLWTPHAEGVERKDIMKKFASREDALHTLWRPHRPILQGPVNPYISMMRDSQSTLTWSVSPHVNKHLIKFPVALKPTSLRSKGNNTDSPQSTPSTVLLKADTGADINLMNRKTFNQLFGDSKVLKPTPIKMENYGNTAVKVLGMFHAFLRWKDKVYRQLFYVTDCDRSPQLAVKGCLLHSGSSKTMLHCGEDYYKKDYLKSNCECMYKRWCGAAKSFHHQKMNGSEEKLSNDSNKAFYLTEPPSRSSIDQAGHSWCLLWCFYQDREVSRNAIQVPIEGKCKTHETCT